VPARAQHRRRLRLCQGLQGRQARQLPVPPRRQQLQRRHGPQRQDDHCRGRAHCRARRDQPRGHPPAGHLRQARHPEHRGQED
ncbi:hypothetical protein BN1723_020799, partial [Verticillium longisporum]